MLSAVSDDNILNIYSWFQSAMRSVGRNVKPPRAQDFRKTYTYRPVKKFAEQCADWGLDERTTKMLVYDIVKYGARQRILDKGVNMLTMGTVLDICRQSIKDAIEADAILTNELTLCREFLNKNGKDSPVKTLTEPVTIGGYTNFVYWFNQGRLTPTYVALSRTCLRALIAIPEGERSELPPDEDLLRICTHTVCADNLRELIDIMGNDLRIPPTVRIQ